MRANRSAESSVAMPVAEVEYVHHQFDSLPGGKEVEKGLEDIRRGRLTEEAMLVSLAAPRLRSVGLVLPELPNMSEHYEHALFNMLEERLPRGAHAAYNALIGLIVSFANAFSQV